MDGGTLIGVLGGPVARGPGRLGLDAMFPAFFAVLLAERGAREAADDRGAPGGVIALVLMPFAPPGMPVLAAVGAALLGLRTQRAAAAGPA